MYIWILFCLTIVSGAKIEDKKNCKDALGKRCVTEPHTTPGAPGDSDELPARACDDDPCDNGGECHNEDDGGFTCDCPDGFEGTLCEINIDECESSPCQFGGTCNDLANAFSCDCPRGFSGDTCAVCGGVFNEDEGDGFSPFFPHVYPNDIHCQYLIKVEPGQTITVYFEEFSTEESWKGFIYDSVNIYDGNSTDSASLGEYYGTPCWEDVGYNLPHQNFYSTDNCMLLDFNTDESVSYYGFHFRWSVSDCDEDGCNNGGSCNPATNTCICPPSYVGDTCSLLESDIRYNCDIYYTDYGYYDVNLQPVDRERPEQYEGF